MGKTFGCIEDQLLEVKDSHFACIIRNPKFNHTHLVSSFLDTHLDFVALHLLEVVWDAVCDDDLVDVRLLDEARVRQQPVRRQSVDLVRAALLREFVERGKFSNVFQTSHCIS